METNGEHVKEGRLIQPGLSGRAAFLDAEIWECIDWFQRRREKNRTLAFALKICATILSAVTTVLLGLQSAPFADHKAVVVDVALAVSSTVTVLGAIESFFDFRGLWVRYTETRARLMTLRARLLFLTSGDGPIDEEKLEKIFESYEAILAESNDAWLQMRRQPGHTVGNSATSAK